MSRGNDNSQYSDNEIRQAIPDHTETKDNSKIHTAAFALIHNAAMNANTVLISRMTSLLVHSYHQF